MHLRNSSINKCPSLFIKVKVLHIITGDLWAGAEVQASTLILALKEMHGIEEQVITFNEGMLTENLRRNGFTFTVVDESMHGIPALISTCMKEIASFMPDIVHTHGFKENFTCGIAARIKGAKVIRTHHGKGMIGGKLRYMLIEQINARFLADALISVSRDLENFLVASGLPPEKITVIHNGAEPIDLPSIEKIQALKQEFQIPDNSRVIGTTGRLVPVKNHMLFLKAARIINEAMPGTRFVITGDGPLLAELKSYARSLGINHNVIFTGFRNDAKLIAGIFDIFALTSVHEGIPMVLLEAMSLGKPVVSTYVGGIPEIIENGTNGILVTPGDERSFATACLNVLSDETLRKRLLIQAERDIREKHSLAASVSKTYELYKKVAGS
jgi:L-malate glycosyltransferase